VFANGDVAPDQADALARLADAADLAVRIANHHRMVVFGPNDSHLDAALAALSKVEGPALDAAAQPQASVVACPGTRWCKCALADTNRLADRLRERYARRLDPAITVCLSGCPNGCAHSAVADIGLVGTLARRDGERAEAYTLLAGGGMGRDARLAETVARRLSADEAVEAVADFLGRV
jgi:ferredoxin-nitrite reductase